MPELPEVEITRRGLSPFLTQQQIVAVNVRQPRLRWPVPTELALELPGLTIEQVDRRAKYLLLRTHDGTVIIHLGMSGSLRMAELGSSPNQHDHVDLVLKNGHCVRLRDPRRFGAILWTRGDVRTHPLIAKLGPEPFSDPFHGQYLHHRSRGRRMAIKSFIMDSQVVAGIGNIYANEALYLAGIHPARPVHRISKPRYERLSTAIKQVLEDAIAAGGTSLRDFVNSIGQPGYFSQSLRVYGRSGQACEGCGRTLRHARIGQRSSFYCPHCQR
jgi:formamidopyrimidine-DNA glycosylase